MYFLHALLKNAYMPIFIYLFEKPGLDKNRGRKMVERNERY
jgi:hypothetical protein